MQNRDLPDREELADDLTWRERDILNLLGERLTNREIAERLYLAESTVKDYVGNILGKLNVKNRREAAERAKDLGLLEHDRATITGPLTHLPPERTPFIGRKHELSEIKRQLGETRLLSLTGPGGIGKTRLALKVAEAVAGDFKDGVFFISLAPIRSAKDMIQTIAEVLKFPIATHEDPQHQLLRYLRKRHMLLVMDNFEHLLDGVSYVSELLQAAPEVMILATSRERLNLQSEIVFHVAGMHFPTEADSQENLTYDAIALFLQCARRVRPGFDPTSEELKRIGTICQFVEGMPLAIELAAAWLHILTVNEIAGELIKDFDILVSEMRDAPERHRSIRAVFDHSWSLLEQTEQEAVMRLSVFRGGFTREAAQQVAGASLHLLLGLVNKSFLNHDPDAGRLEIHELLRQYAQERLEQTGTACQSARDAHAAYYAKFMQQRWEHLRGERQMLAIAEIEADIENVRAAWQFYLDQRNAPQLWKLIYGIWYFYYIRWWNHAGIELFAQAASALHGVDKDETVALRALAMAYQAYFMAFVGLAEQAIEIAEASVAILERISYPQALAFAYESLALNAYLLNRIPEEIQAMEKMLTLARQIDDTWLLAFALYCRSLGAIVQDDYDQADRLAQTNLKLYREVGDVIGSTTPLIVLGHAAFGRGELEAAKGYYLQCLKISQEAGFHYAIQTSSKYLCRVAISLGETSEAETYLVQSLRITQEIGFLRDIINLFYEYARLLVAQANFVKAAELLGLVIHHPASEFYRMLEGQIRDSAQVLLAEIEPELPPMTFQAALERGQQLDLDEILANLIGPQARE